MLEETGVAVNIERGATALTFRSGSVTRCYFVCGIDNVTSESLPVVKSPVTQDKSEIDRVRWMTRATLRTLARSAVNHDLWAWVRPRVFNYRLVCTSARRSWMVTCKGSLNMRRRRRERDIESINVLLRQLGGAVRMVSPPNGRKAMQRPHDPGIPTTKKKWWRRPRKTPQLRGRDKWPGAIRHTQWYETVAAGEIRAKESPQATAN